MTINSTQEEASTPVRDDASAIPSSGAEAGTETETHGAKTAVKNLYKSKTDEDDVWTWTDKYPEDVLEAAENDESQLFAVIVRNVKSTDARKKLEAHSIIIQSPWLREALGHVFQDYPGVACELKRLIFDAPFQPFLHRWAAFIEYMRRDDLDATTRQHFGLLHDILKYEIGDNITAFEDYVLNRKITYDKLWMIFEPGSVVLSAHKGPLSAFEIGRTFYCETRAGKVFRLQADYVDHDGTTFGRSSSTIDIPQFSGVVDITSLGAFPLALHEDPASIRAHLIRRGETFASLAGHHYKSYDGRAIKWNDNDDEVSLYVNGRIVVDIATFGRLSDHCRYVKDWNAKDKERLAACSSEGSDGELISFDKLTPYHYLICQSRTCGYSLKHKEWMEFDVEHIGEIVWNNKAYESLVLPQDQKELILAFSESQIGGAAMDDVISGKGNGIICLLSGPPGVGKTLTAEAVAEHMRVPLHTLTAGDLGSEPEDIESELNRVLDLVARWKAVVLLDECDVFLEQRSKHDLQRNNVVSIFLRMLEYYQGILFMTTNRVETIDPAFRSRIHVLLEYPDLNQESRRKIWDNFLSMWSFKHEMTEADLVHLSSLALNGREIKNVLKTAQLVASWRKSVLKREFIDMILAIGKQTSLP